MTPEQIADNRTDLLTFTQTMFRARKGVDMRMNWHQAEICRHLEMVVIGKIKRLIINIPPRSGKTELAVKNFIAWCMGNFPDCEFIHASYSKRLATANTYEARAIMQHEVYCKIFPRTALQHDSKAKDEFRTAQGGIVYATGSEGTITGYGAGKMRDYFGGCTIIDDPHKAGEATSETMRQNVIDWYSTTMESRLNTRETPVIVIMQRLHEDDLTGWLLAGGNGEEWNHLCIPAISDDESFWPQQFPIDELRRMERANQYVFAGQYQQIPAPIGGGMFPVAEFDIVANPPKIIGHPIRYWDKAGTDGGGAFTAGVKMGRTENGFVVLDVVRGQWSAYEREKRIKQTAEMDGTSCHVWIEQEPGSGGKESAENTIRNLAGFVIKSERATGEKSVRAQPYAAQVQGGNVKIIKADWNKDFLNEHETFPNGKYKDQVDAAAGAFNKLVSGHERKKGYGLTMPKVMG